jgi:hypothetical protein
MWPLMLASILALDTVIERAFFLLIEQLRRDTRAVKQFFAAVAQGDASRSGLVSRILAICDLRRVKKDCRRHA